ncbi:hypothetical protein [Bradyrhizobium sp. BR13661]|jgi:hypothetical protein|uniref:hypothetical protein n=1 Tax=Bradyrhizobium sp. BR13661 TaxID=2940622 RepID=UPI002474CC1B|nr:hypothetical protein [Bradyrhizobium sp. BR13661]MDH6258957.1 hypothetical protein [Bradyrhizobium sp. BR13661]
MDDLLIDLWKTVFSNQPIVAFIDGDTDESTNGRMRRRAPRGDAQTARGDLTVRVLT